MKILISSHYGLPHKGGVEVATDKLATKWQSIGHNVTHICSIVDSNDQPTFYRQIRLPAINFLERFAIPYPIFNPWNMLRHLPPLVAESDVVNIQGMLYMNNVFIAFLAHRRGVPVVLTEYPGFVDYGNKWINLIEKMAFAIIGRFSSYHSSAFIYINQKVGESLFSYFKKDCIHKQIKVGVDTSYFKPATESERQRLRDKWKFTKPTMLFAGRLVYRKGINILKDIYSDQFDVVICGRGASSINNPKARFLGFVSDAELLELYQACDSFILLSDGNDFPLVGLETMACGLPVVLFNIASNLEYHTIDTAIFVEQSADAIIDGLSNLARDSQKQSKMSKAARKRAVEYFDWAIVSQQYLQVFNSLLDTE